jgi:hypothetical protein
MIEKYETFIDIDEPKLRAKNRAIVMANIFVDNSKENDITKEGAAKLFNYFDEVPHVDRGLAFSAFQSEMEDRGYKYGG